MTAWPRATLRERSRPGGAPTERFNIEQVPFAPVASLWPLRLSRARLASVVGRHAEALKASVTFLRIAGFVDQAAWPIALSLRADAALAIGDTVLAINTYADLVDLLPEADGTALAARTRAERALSRLSP